MYTRAMFVFFGLISYWQEKELPIFKLFQRSPTFFSEESGEIGLSVLTKSRPASMRCDYEQTRKAWVLVKEMYTAGTDALRDSKAPNPKKAYRTIGIPTSLVHRRNRFCCFDCVHSFRKNATKVFFGCFDHNTVLENCCVFNECGLRQNIQKILLHHFFYVLCVR